VSSETKGGWVSPSRRWGGRVGVCGWEGCGGGARRENGGGGGADTN